jgi:hypothetical protein
MNPTYIFKSNLNPPTDLPSPNPATVPLVGCNWRSASFLLRPSHPWGATAVGCNWESAAAAVGRSQEMGMRRRRGAQSSGEQALPSWARGHKTRRPRFLFFL